MTDQPQTILCLGHLNWEHVWQRPQQLMSRFAERCRVIYVNPPDLGTTGQALELREQTIEAGVRVLRPIFPKRLLEPKAANYRELWKQLFPEALQQAGPHTILWAFSPLADYLVAAAKPHVELTVYDCMDDLASFRDGTQEMRERENNLLHLVDLVFTGGRSMYEARKDRHPHVYCFPSGVDVAHYQQVHDPSLEEPAQVRAIPHPRLGYFGVLDERIDWPLIAAIAERRPDWHWILVGPTAKVKRSELPVAPNIHYVGQQSYAALPAYLKSFDLATMPFALNEATRFISPTKTLEYLAGGKDVISTSVPDVVATYQQIVTIVDGVDGWIEAINNLLVAPPSEREARRQRAQPVIEHGSWDGIVTRMWQLMQERLAQIRTSRA